MNNSWQDEYDRFKGMPQDRRAYWVGRWMYHLTIAARDNYSRETGLVTNADKLKDANEFMHQLIQWQLKILKVKDHQMSDDNQFIEWFDKSIAFFDIKSDRVLLDFQQQKP